MRTDRARRQRALGRRGWLRTGMGGGVCLLRRRCTRWLVVIHRRLAPPPFVLATGDLIGNSVELGVRRSFGLLQIASAGRLWHVRHRHGRRTCGRRSAFASHRGLEFRQAWRAAPLHTLARGCQNFLRTGRATVAFRRGCRLCCRWCGARWRRWPGLHGSPRRLGRTGSFPCLGGLLQGAYRVLERQPVRAQHVRGGAAAIANDRRQHDGTVDLATAAARGGCGRFQHMAHFGRDRKRSRAALQSSQMR